MSIQDAVQAGLTLISWCLKPSRILPALLLTAMKTDQVAQGCDLHYSTEDLSSDMRRMAVFGQNALYPNHGRCFRARTVDYLDAVDRATLGCTIGSKRSQDCLEDLREARQRYHEGLEECGPCQALCPKSLRKTPYVVYDSRKECLEEYECKGYPDRYRRMCEWYLPDELRSIHRDYDACVENARAISGYNPKDRGHAITCEDRAAFLNRHLEFNSLVAQCAPGPCPNWLLGDVKTLIP